MIKKKETLRYYAALLKNRNTRKFACFYVYPTNGTANIFMRESIWKNKIDELIIVRYFNLK